MNRLSSLLVVGLSLLGASAPAAATCPADMVEVSGGAACVDRYEASRPGATAESAGTDNESPPQSVAGVLPWGKLTLSQADAACAAAGKRLCTWTELQEACGVPKGQRYPYGSTYEPTACNGYAAGVSKAAPTGSFPSCVSPAGAFDLSGNLQEWTATKSPTGNACAFGGDYFKGELSPQENEDAESCDPKEFFCIGFSDPAAAFGNLGFRCCKDEGSGGGDDAGSADPDPELDAGADVTADVAADAAPADAAGPDGGSLADSFPAGDTGTGPDADMTAAPADASAGPELGVDGHFLTPKDTGDASSGGAGGGSGGGDGCGAAAAPAPAQLVLIALLAWAMLRHLDPRQRRRILTGRPLRRSVAKQPPSICRNETQPPRAFYSRCRHR